MNDMPSTPDQPGGIYIHVPFCREKCAYCDFYSITALDRVPDFIQALATELRLSCHRIPAADTIYFGGGTPSLLTPRQIAEMLTAVHTRFEMSSDVEVTLEVNPGTVTPVTLRGFRDAGVNRLNIGLQSLDDAALRFLGRIHTAGQGVETYERAREAGFDNVGLDLIYGLPDQTVSQWAHQLAAVARLGADHLSCYTLTLEAGTPLARKVDQGAVDPPDEGLVGDLFAYTAQWLNANGYRQYEVSNFARCAPAPGDRIDRRSRHNRKYWTFAPYLGFGPAAHSFMNGRRWWNHRRLDRYLAELAAGRPPVAETETLTPEQQMIEFVYLGLRQTDGIDITDFKRRFGRHFLDCFDRPAHELLREGLMEKAVGRIRLTGRGMRFLESVVGRLLA